MVSTFGYKEAAALDLNRQYHHYTSYGGLTGILQSHVLWATHWKFLNDPSETRTGIFRLCCLMSMVLENLLEDREEFKQLVIRGIDVKSPIVADVQQSDTYRQCIEKMKNRLVHFVSWRANLEIDQFPAFITSLSWHKNFYDKMNGAISQWREYGKEGGYCIILDARCLKDQLDHTHRDTGSHPYVYVRRVNYELYQKPDDESSLPNNMIAQQTKLAREILLYYITGAYPPDMREKEGQLYTSFLITNKEYYFRGEEEVRLVVGGRVNNTDRDELPITPVFHRESGGGIIPYIKVLHGVERLPIVRIIIGPHENAENRYYALRSFLQKTPYSDVGINLSSIKLRYNH